MKKSILNKKGVALLETAVFAVVLVFIMCSVVKIIFMVTKYEQAAISDHIKFLKE